MEKMKVLIVDDMDYVRMILKKNLESLEHYDIEVIGEASNGEEAVKKYKTLESELDLVTMDITMPKMDGLSALEKMKGIREGIPIVMLTILGDKKKVLRALDLGAKGYILKPFNKEKIEKTLDTIFKG